MSTSNRSVHNLNSLSGTSFTFQLANFPNLNFTVQDANLPSVVGRAIEMSTPIGKWNAAMDKIEYEVLELSFLVDETLNNWREVYNWMRALAPTNLFSDSNQYSVLKNSSQGKLVSPATLYILTNALNINLKVEFKNVFPISLSGIDFSTQDTTDRKIHCKVTFAYDYYDITVVDTYNQEGYVPSNIIT